MSITYDQALDEIYGIAKAVFDDSQWPTLFGYTLDIRYQGVPKASKPDMQKLWVRVSSQIVGDGQASLTNVQGARMYEAHGLLFIQLFCPRNVGGSLDKGMKLAMALQNAFRKPSPSNEIWFEGTPGQVIRVLPETEESYPVNVVVAFRYQTLNTGA